MHTELRMFLHRLTGVITITLAPVVLTAFISMPLSLNRHPGELPLLSAAAPSHMT
jgi:hypothetical protein